MKKGVLVHQPPIDNLFHLLAEGCLLKSHLQFETPPLSDTKTTMVFLSKFSSSKVLSTIPTASSFDGLAQLILILIAGLSCLILIGSLFSMKNPSSSIP